MYKYDGYIDYIRTSMTFDDVINHSNFIIPRYHGQYDTVVPDVIWSTLRAIIAFNGSILYS